MEFSMFCSKISFLIFLVVLSYPSKFNQSPMDFGPLNLLQATNTSSLDFGRIYFNSPSAVLRPQSPKEISLLLSSLSGSSFSKVTVAARGAGHSINGQAQALNGIVVEMDSLPSSIKIRKIVDGESSSYVDVSGGTLWVDLLKETLKEGLAPRSWTDYLYLTIGGTLSNAGISGQTFKYGPQISNVLQLDVVTGRGEIVTCSPNKSSELFYGVLGGLGQFGIITSARILLQEAPRKVKWVRAYYDDFDIFTKDQELLIGMGNMVDYLEGFIVLNKESLHGGSISFPFPTNLASISQFQSEPSKVYYCIEFAVYDQADKNTNLDQVVEEISSKMSFLPSVLFSVEVSYFDFLQRVRMEELSLRELGLWDVSHPWLNMFVPKSGIAQFRDLLLENISPSTFVGPILIYPMSRDKWNMNMSAVLPESNSGENITYIVGILRSANPTSCSQECLQGYLRQNLNITKIATDPKGGIGAKQYLSNHRKEEQWKEHFGGKWEQFLARKKAFDPLNILAPGQGIFRRRYSMNPITTTTATPLTLSSSQ